MERLIENEHLWSMELRANGDLPGARLAEEKAGRLVGLKYRFIGIAEQNIGIEEQDHE